jgi:hypothetical protein
MTQGIYPTAAYLATDSTEIAPYRYVVEISDTGSQGVPGPPGADGESGNDGATTLMSQYTWTEDVGPKHEVEDGFIAGENPSDVTDGEGRLSIAQIDALGRTYGFFEAKPGDRILFQNADNSGYDIVEVTLREGCSDEQHACLRYTVVQTDGLPTQGGDMQVVLLSEPSGGEPGSPGAKWFDGEGPPQEPIPNSNPGDYYLDTLTGDVYELTGVAVQVRSLVPLTPEGA